MSHSSSLKRKIYWNQIGEKYRLTWKKGGRSYISFQEKSFINQAISFLPSTSIKALDLGCGTGRILSILKKNPKVKSIQAVDGSEEMVNYCQKKFKKPLKIKKIILSDISKKLPFPSESFDLITTIRTIKYNKNWQEILSDCFRLLKKRGILIFDMPNQNSINHFSYCEIPIYKTSEEELRKILKTLGFEILVIKGGPVLPGFFYDHLKDGFLFRIILKTEGIFKRIFGQASLSRYLYLTCQKTR